MDFPSSEGILTGQEEQKCRDALDLILLTGKVMIPEKILQSLFCFTRYCLLGAMHLNRLASGLNDSQNNENSNKSCALPISEQKILIIVLSNRLNLLQKQFFIQIIKKQVN